jgi:oxygen-independent coproporphyrinogen-3 oxidase
LACPSTPRPWPSGAPARPALAQPLSLYVHIPFCESLCYYCACNKIITKHHEPQVSGYLRYLEPRDRSAHRRAGPGPARVPAAPGRRLAHLPVDDELRELMAMLRRRLQAGAGGRISIEVDPRTVDAQRLTLLAELGFNRLSFGVQDFDPDVQKAVHRMQPAPRCNLVEEARELGFRVHQHRPDLRPAASRRPSPSRARSPRCSSCGPTALRCMPMPTCPSASSRSGASTRPSCRRPAKVRMLGNRCRRSSAAGYTYIGMDHFALPNDALAVAKRQGRLHRNFQGYSTQPDCDLIGLGVSAIGRMGATYSQNAKTLEEYYDALRPGPFPVVRGLALNRDDLARRAVIMALMCQGQVLFESIELAWLIDFKTYFAAELEQLKTLEDQGMVTMDDTGVQVTAQGWFFVRAVGMVFDRYLQADRNRAKFSRII